MSLSPQKPNDESSPSQRLLPPCFSSGFLLATGIFHFFDHFLVFTPISYIFPICSLLLLFFPGHFLMLQIQQP